MELFQKGGWYLPNGEKHLQPWMLRVNDWRDGRLLYQGRKYREALKFVKQHRHAIDIGAHVGLWSWQLAKDFATVHAFEPMPEHQECFRANVKAENVHLYSIALGPETKQAFIRTRTVGSSGDTGIEESGTPVEMRRLDELVLQDIDFMKIDCEGFEVFVLRGALETLIRCKPCIIVEQKPETGMAKRYGIGVTDAVKLLQGMGATVRKEIQGDYILSW